MVALVSTFWSLSFLWMNEWAWQESDCLPFALILLTNDSDRMLVLAEIKIYSIYKLKLLKWLSRRGTRNDFWILIRILRIENEKKAECVSWSERIGPLKVKAFLCVKWQEQSICLKTLKMQWKDKKISNRKIASRFFWEIRKSQRKSLWPKN